MLAWPTERRERVLMVVVGIALLTGLCMRGTGLVWPAASSGDEFAFLKQTARLAEFGTLPDARFWLHGHLVNILSPTGISTAGAAFALALASSIGTACFAALTANNLFGRRAGVICLVLSALSLTQINYANKVLGIGFAAAPLAIALFLLTSRERWKWYLGAVFLAVSFSIHYHVGLVALALGAGILVSDLSALKEGGVWRSLLERLGVGSVALLIAGGYLLLLGSIYETSQIDRLTGHENFSVPIVHSSFHWLYAMCRLDPVLWIVILAAALLSYRQRINWIGMLAAAVASWRQRVQPGSAFLRQQQFLICCALLVVGLCLFRPLASMTRQIFPAILVFQIAASALLANLWQWGEQWSNRRASVAVMLIVVSLVTLTLASRDWLGTRGRRYPTVEREINTQFPDVAIDRLRYASHFVGTDAGLRKIHQYGRRPDVVVRGARFFPFPRLDEEPYKIDAIERGLEERGLTELVQIDELIHTQLLYTTPKLAESQQMSIRQSLPWMVQLAVK